MSKHISKIIYYFLIKKLICQNLIKDKSIMISTTKNTLILVLDASSSMNQFNQLELLKVLTQTANDQENINRLVIVQFSDECSIVLDEQVPSGKTELSIDKLSKIYQIDGCTALNDAILMACDVAKNDTNDKQVVLIMTDGHENSSKVRKVEVVKEEILSAQQKEVVFIGLGFRNDIAKSYGLPEGKCIEFAHTDDGMREVCRAASEVMRSHTSELYEGSHEFTPEHRSASAEVHVLDHDS
jgi:Mg-chelatase subunit ChlD